MAVIEIFDNDDEQAQAEATKTPKTSKPRSRSKKSAAGSAAASDTPAHVSGPSAADSEAARKASGTGRKSADGKTSGRKPAEGKTRSPRKAAASTADTATPAAETVAEAKPARKPRTRKKPEAAVAEAAVAAEPTTLVAPEAVADEAADAKPKRTRRGGKSRKRTEAPEADNAVASEQTVVEPSAAEPAVALTDLRQADSEQTASEQTASEQTVSEQASPEQASPVQPSVTDEAPVAPLLEIAAAPEKVAIAAAPERSALEAAPIRPTLPALTQFSPAPNAPPLVLPQTTMSGQAGLAASAAAEAETSAASSGEADEVPQSKSRSRSARRRKAARKRAEAAAAAAAGGSPVVSAASAGVQTSERRPESATGRLEIFDAEFDAEDDEAARDAAERAEFFGNVAAPDYPESGQRRERAEMSFFGDAADGSEDSEDSETREVSEVSENAEAPKSRRSRSRRGRGKKAAGAAAASPETTGVAGAAGAAGATGATGATGASGSAADPDDEYFDDEDDGPVTPPKTDRRMLVSVLPRELVEVVIMDDGKVQEYYVEMEHQAKIRGNIYKAVVSNIDVNLQAAFVNYGNVKNGFLQIDEVHPEYWLTHHEVTKGHKYPPIQKVMKPGQEVLVQVVKEPNGAKGAFLTTWVSLAGRFLVLTPGQEQIGISRKVEDGEERNRLRELIKGLNPGEGLGAIVRTVSAGTSKTTLQKDLSFLKRVWKDIRKRAGSEKAPCLIYKEPSLATRAVRDYLSDDVAEVWVDDAETAEAIRDMTSLLFPRKADLLHLHQNSSKTLWEQFKVRKYLDQIHAREVFLPSGGRLVFDQTEALMAIDINSGKSGGKTNFESMALRTNVEAAEMIAHQLRLRDIGGQVVIDFIEMRDQSHCREVEKTMRNAMKGDRARYDIGKMSSFGLMQIVRQRIGSSAISISQEACPHCSGTGLRRNMEWQSLQILRDLKVQMRNAATTCQPELLLPLETELAVYILNHKRERLCALEKEFGVRLEIRVGVDKVVA